MFSYRMSMVVSQLGLVPSVQGPQSQVVITITSIQQVVAFTADESTVVVTIIYAVIVSLTEQAKCLQFATPLILGAAAFVRTLTTVDGVKTVRTFDEVITLVTK